MRPSTESPTRTMHPTRIGAAGETGRVPVSHLGVIVETRYVYVDPVILAFVNTRNGDESTDVRVKDVTSRSFRLFLEEAPHLDGEHNEEEVSYVVMEAGTRVLEGGLAVEAGRHVTSAVHRGGQAFLGDRIDFAVPFNETPAVLTTLNTYENGDFMSSLATAVGTDGFEISQEALETGVTAVKETIGWMAFSTGTGMTTGGSPYLSSYDVDNGVTNGVGQVAYSIDLTSAGFAEKPDLVVGLDQDNGMDGAYARGAGTFTATAQTIFAEEDQQEDTERQHASIPVAWVGFGHDTDLFEDPAAAFPARCRGDMEPCEFSHECCSGECLGEGRCMASEASQ
uniref:Uncharacterized protein n=1 Tax=Odontella aurita TaxID=265563 RepID=A0A7S4II57_9STRA